MLRRLRNWCKKARFKPGLVEGGGICVDGDDRSPRPAALGGFKNSRRCASNVVGFVGRMVTFEVSEDETDDL